ncbi:hypothetical protein AMST5_00463 [freshwater sediment metagenome]|uniref:DUF3168 domain-containing protein n=1 Tax=freshwater sediment metagenome TaxID=556182 RepID=A0AA48LYF4_9ZZZZ
MSASPVIALRKAIRARLLSDAPLIAALGGPRVYEEAPQGAATPYALFTEAQMRDWSGALSRGAEQFMTIAVVSTQRGLGPALGVAQQITELLDEASLSLEGHSLIDLRFVSMDTKRDASGRFARVAVIFRATTEYL